MTIYLMHTMTRQWDGAIEAFLTAADRTASLRAFVETFVSADPADDDVPDDRVTAARRAERAWDDDEWLIEMCADEGHDIFFDEATLPVHIDGDAR